MKSPCNIWLLQFIKHLTFLLAEDAHIIPLRALFFESFVFLWQDMKRNQKLLEVMMMISTNTHTN